MIRTAKARCACTYRFTRSPRSRQYCRNARSRIVNLRRRDAECRVSTTSTGGGAQQFTAHAEALSLKTYQFIVQESNFQSRPKWIQQKPSLTIVLPLSIDVGLDCPPIIDSPFARHLQSAMWRQAKTETIRRFLFTLKSFVPALKRDI